MGNSSSSSPLLIQAAILNFGFLESSYAGSLMLRRYNPPFNPLTTAKAAVADLASFFLEKWKHDVGYIVTEEEKLCCVKAIKAKQKYCPCCGVKTEESKSKQYDLGDFSSWISGQFCHNIESWGSYVGDWLPWTCFTEIVDILTSPNGAVLEVMLAEKTLIPALSLQEVPLNWRKPLKNWKKTPPEAAVRVVTLENRTSVTYNF